MHSRESCQNSALLLQSLGLHPLTSPDRIWGLFWLLHLVKGYVHGDEQIRLFVLSMAGCLWIMPFSPNFWKSHSRRYCTEDNSTTNNTQHHSILKFLAETTTMDTSERLRVEFWLHPKIPVVCHRSTTWKVFLRCCKTRSWQPLFSCLALGSGPTRLGAKTCDKIWYLGPLPTLRCLLCMKSVQKQSGGWGLNFENPSQWATVFKYFRPFKEKQWPRTRPPCLFCHFCSEALQQLLVIHRFET